jgi:ubiquinone/menaquinone biosynthesis C-methylase UbiE
MKCEPNRLEIFLTRLAFLICGRCVYQSFADHLPLEGWENVLDFGCGMGTVAYYAAKKLPHGHLTCLDISERWLNACRKTLRNHGNISYLLWEFPMLDDECFDVVYCHFVLHDISDSELEIVLPELAGSLKSQGVLVFREPLTDTNKISF